MKIVYIAHPISGSQKLNMKTIVDIVRQIHFNHPDVCPIVPYYVNLLALDDQIEGERNRGIDCNIEILRRGLIDELWVYGDWKNSKGCLAEIDLALELSIPVKYRS